MAVQTVHPLRQERQRRGWSQSYLAQLVGVTPRSVGRWERGLTSPYPIYRNKLCTLFGKDAEALGLLPPHAPDAADASMAVSVSQKPVEFSAMEGAVPAVYDPLAAAAMGRARSLVGRDRLLGDLKQRLRGQGRRVALSGLPGVGKTAVAATLVMDRQVQEYFRDGILWAGIGSDPDLFSLLGRWLKLLGAMLPTEKRAFQLQEWCQAARMVIGNRRMLIVLDDVWQVETAMMLQVGGPNCVYLLTTRLPQVAFAFAEQDAIIVPELSEEDAMMFLQQSIPDVVRQESEQIRTLVRAVGCLPLALRLVAHVLSVQVFTGQPRRVQQALKSLREMETRLRISAPTIPGEFSNRLQQTQLSLQATIAMSELQLGERTRLALHSLAIFSAKPESFVEEAALEVAQVPPEVLDELWDAGLLESYGQGRYQLHQTIADYARMQGIPAGTSQRLVQFVIGYLREHEHEYELLDKEMPTMLVALDISVETTMQQELIDMIDMLAPFLDRRGRYVLAEQYLQKAYSAAKSLQDFSQQLRIVQHLANFTEKAGNYAQAEQYVVQGLEMARRLGDEGAQSAFLTTRGLIEFDHGNFGQASMFYQQGLELARRVNDSRRVCILLGFLAAMQSMQGHYDESVRLGQEGLELARQLNDGESITQLLASLARVVTLQGKYELAEAFLLEGLALVDRLGYQGMKARLLNNLADIARFRGEYEQEEAYLLECLQLARQSGSGIGLYLSLIMLSDCMLRKQDYVEAERYIEEGFKMARQSKNRTLHPSLLANQGELWSQKGDYARANSCLEEAVSLARGSKAPWMLSRVLGVWANIHLRFGDLDAATLNFQEVCALNSDPQKVAEAMYGLAQVEMARGNVQEANQLGQQSLSTLERLNPGKAAEVSTWLSSLP